MKTTKKLYDAFEKEIEAWQKDHKTYIGFTTWKYLTQGMDYLIYRQIITHDRHFHEYEDALKNEFPNLGVFIHPIDYHFELFVCVFSSDNANTFITREDEMFFSSESEDEQKTYSFMIKDISDQTIIERIRQQGRTGDFVLASELLEAQKRHQEDITQNFLTSIHTMHSQKDAHIELMQKIPFN